MGAQVTILDRRREVGQEEIKIETPLPAALPDALRPVMARATPPTPKSRMLSHAPQWILDPRKSQRPDSEKACA
jgi:hypothetical protein